MVPHVNEAGLNCGRSVKSDQANFASGLINHKALFGDLANSLCLISSVYTTYTLPGHKSDVYAPSRMNYQAQMSILYVGRLRRAIL